MMLFVVLWGAYELFLFDRQCKFAAKQKFVYLAIDIPRTNMQSPKALENFFSTLAGAHTSFEWEEKLFDGAGQLGFSLEIVGIDGSVQFLIRTPVQWRDMVEAALYSQYQDAEITLVDDYAKEINVKFPSDEYNIWGADLVLYANECFPIRSYEEFEHPMSKDIKDPITTLIEVMNKMRPGEQFWYQLMIYPTDSKWVSKGLDLVKKLSGQTIVAKPSKLDKVLNVPMSLLSEASTQAFGMFGLGSAEPEVKKDAKPMMFLPPAEKIQCEAVANKLAKTGFKSKLRIVYFGKKEVFNKGLGVSGTFGAIKQFSNLNLNGFKPDKNKTTVRWPWFKAQRLGLLQNRILKAYKSRASDTASEKYILNVEELASLWHFPFFETRGPIVKRIDAKKVNAPVGLPILPGVSIGKKPAAVASSPSDNLPGFEYDDDYFEKHFAIDKTGEADKARKAYVLGLSNKRTGAMGSTPSTSAAPVKNQPIIGNQEQGEEGDFTAKFAKEPVESFDSDDDGSSGRGAPPPNLPVI